MEIIKISPRKPLNFHAQGIRFEGVDPLLLIDGCYSSHMSDTPAKKKRRLSPPFVQTEEDGKIDVPIKWLFVGVTIDRRRSSKARKEVEESESAADSSDDVVLYDEAEEGSESSEDDEEVEQEEAAEAADLSWRLNALPPKNSVPETIVYVLETQTMTLATFTVLEEELTLAIANAYARKNGDVVRCILEYFANGGVMETPIERQLLPPNVRQIRKGMGSWKKMLPDPKRWLEIKADRTTIWPMSFY
jgi:hypothetical protein